MLTRSLASSPLVLTLGPRLALMFAGLLEGRRLLFRPDCHFDQKQNTCLTKDVATVVNVSEFTIYYMYITTEECILSVRIAFLTCSPKISMKMVRVDGSSCTTPFFFHPTVRPRRKPWGQSDSIIQKMLPCESFFFFNLFFFLLLTWIHKISPAKEISNRSCKCIF